MSSITDTPAAALRLNFKRCSKKAATGNNKMDNSMANSSGLNTSFANTDK